MERAYEYGILLKPKVLLAMIALYVTSYFASVSNHDGGKMNLNLFLTGFIAVLSAVSGANALNCYIDRDIDAKMIRTRNRPLATGSISNIEALYFSGFMMFTASVISIYLGTIAVLMLIIGAGSYLYLYSVLFKRKTSMNVFANAPSVAAPVLFGWYLGGSPIFPVGFLMGFLVAIWGPLHLWSLAFAYSKDYSKVDIPMFPSVVSRNIAINGILLALSFLIGSSYLLSLFARTSSYIIGVTIINISLIISGLNFYKKGSNKSGWIIFKLTAPYIIIILSIFTLNLQGFI